jgi:hypothetical protein
MVSPADALASVIVVGANSAAIASVPNDVMATPPNAHGPIGHSTGRERASEEPSPSRATVPAMARAPGDCSDIETLLEDQPQLPPEALVEEALPEPPDEAGPVIAAPDGLTSHHLAPN